MVKQAVRSLGLGLLFLTVTTSAAFGVAVYGAIGEKYAQLGGERGPLGAPLSDEADAPYGGRFNRFQSGFIYWHPTTGAFGVWGKIGEKYQQLGGPAFGYPITDELATPDGVGRFNHFRAIHLPDAPEASIYWTPETGAQEVYGDIRKAWAAYSWERGPLGYPTSAEFQDGVVRRQNFQRGFILWTAEHGVAVHTPEREAKCKAYAETAVAQASEYFDRRCGQGDDRWQTNYQNHFGFCMGPHGDSMADGETDAREGRLSQCRTTNPPGGDRRVVTGGACNVSAIVRNDECLNHDGTRSSLAPGSLSAEGCGVDRDAALEAAKAGFASQAAIADDPTPGACTYTEEVIAGCICR
jgi:LGFP repeat